ncbi:MAG: UDP-N-acetylmuramoyl-L-alanine--D-glutamate ligase [Candidatus Berkelbacteria bacterium]|nr:UDP-N-acetylmuramoyl-L-alanine--D-glutamate ligase [Candidatus Berkelbacteria bacterium]
MKNLFQEKNIGVFGFGVEGRSLVKYLLSHDAQNIIVFDEKQKDELVVNNYEKVKFIFGEFNRNDYSKIDIAYRSPGVEVDRLKSVLPENVEISSPTNLFFETHKGKIIAITGTKGKSTTALLITKILELNNKNVFTGGNIGSAALDFVDQIDDDSYSVLELSSFQICDLKYSPDVAVILPILSDHLDHHKNEGEYFSAKMNLTNFMQSGDFIISYDDPNIKLFVEKIEARKLYFSEDRKTSDCHLEEELICSKNDQKMKVEKIKDLSQEKKIPEIDLIAAAAFSFALDLKCDLTEVLHDFKKMPYRIEFVGQKNGLNFFNDSAATNPISTIEAIKTMVDPFALILGGSSKNLKFNDLAKAIKENKLIRLIYLSGETANEIEKELSRIGLQTLIKKCSSLQEIFFNLKNQNNFSAVLFSPACASFDQFSNYAERGQGFNNLFQKF